MRRFFLPLILIIFLLPVVVFSAGTKSAGEVCNPEGDECISGLTCVANTAPGVSFCTAPTGGGTGGTAVESACGKDTGLKSEFTKPADWSSYTCKTGTKPPCYARADYTDTAGAGCAGSQLCCPPTTGGGGDTGGGAATGGTDAGVAAGGGGGSSIYNSDPASTKYGLDVTAGAAKLPKIGDLPTIIGNVLGTALSLISVIFFGLMIYGGFMWMTARGNDEQAKKALNTVFSAIIGIIIVMAAYAITTFVFDSIRSAGATPPPTQVTSWCLTAEAQCVQGAGGACSGTQFSAKEACEAAIWWCLPTEGPCIQGGLCTGGEKFASKDACDEAAQQPD